MIDLRSQKKKKNFQIVVNYWARPKRGLEGLQDKMLEDQLKPEAKSPS